MKTINKFFIILTILIIAYSCDDILEEDITDDVVTINYPQNSQQIESNAVNFQWSKLKGADDYRIQVYSSNQNIVLDSLVSTNNFTFALNAGTYQWRVRGENFAYQTAYTFPVSFTLIETDDLTNQIIQPLSPNAGVYLKNTGLSFSWSAIKSAQHYNFQLINITDGNTIIYQEAEFNGTTLSLDSSTITVDAQYQWKVKAINTDNNTETVFATRNFYIDTTLPNQPVNSAPLNNATEVLKDPVTFNWTLPQDTGIIQSSLTHTIQIASDQNFENLLLTDSSSFTTYDYTFDAAGTYYWHVKSTDLAGNQGSYGTFFKITIQ